MCIDKNSHWLLLLLEFDIKIVVQKGKQHFVANHMSRIWTREAPTGVDDELLDGPLFHIDTYPISTLD